jgi:hypothetical protein
MIDRRCGGGDRGTNLRHVRGTEAEVRPPITAAQRGQWGAAEGAVKSLAGGTSQNCASLTGALTIEATYPLPAPH